MPSITLKLAGRTVHFSSDREDPAWSTVAEDLAGHASSASHGDTPDATIVIHPRGWHEPSPLLLPPDARMMRSGGRKVFAGPAGSDVFYIDFHENAFFRIESRQAEGVCYSDERVDPMFWTELSINHVLFILLRRLGIFPLHAGGAIAPDGTAILFTGDSGSGKTTAALRLAAAGWPWLGDDLVLWERDGTIHPLAKIPAATRWTVERLGLEERVRGERRTGKRLLASWPTANPSSRHRIYLVGAATDGKNRCEPVAPELASHVLSMQTAFCATDELTGAPTPDLAPFTNHLQRLWVGDLDGLPEFLSKTGAA